MKIPGKTLAAAALVSLAAAAPASAPAKITEYPLNPSATPLGKAMTTQPGLIRRGVFSALPPGAKPAAVSTTKLAGFPREGNSFAILSTGNARYAALPNTEGDKGTGSGGPSIRGARDVVIMRLDVVVPKGHNCLSFDYRFLSEEYPEFVGDQFNDAFIAELDGSNWSAATKEDPRITAPLNFARDTKGNPIQINKVGPGSMTAFRARGTTFDGATRMLRASTKTTPGLHRLYLSIFDQGDRIYDSAVFLDHLRTSRAATCPTGVAVVG